VLKKLLTLTLFGMCALPAAMLGEEGQKAPSISAIEAGTYFDGTQYSTEDLSPENTCSGAAKITALLVGVGFLFYKIFQFSGCENADNGTWGGDFVGLVNDCN
jgi:hypothetical protein